ncbi:hypothetical protein DLAC_11242 [Tieghemostelium lacteum]|uniref:Cohesin domain-containing protein n=1 Tax=Tieghemostelium lacteum TaxID=361077 RepID=A0A151Z3J4_TIELA|nr:hypothetical protein DLAC_11242 [Tieghemostelium lacteum]|eukprot:KYQ88519.1 hypothetical protein DLAC_11242 [Tieghemostelium lacteum]
MKYGYCLFLILCLFLGVQCQSGCTSFVPGKQEIEPGKAVLYISKIDANVSPNQELDLNYTINQQNSTALLNITYGYLLQYNNVSSWNAVQQVAGSHVNYTSGNQQFVIPYGTFAGVIVRNTDATQNATILTFFDSFCLAGYSTTTNGGGASVSSSTAQTLTITTGTTGKGTALSTSSTTSSTAATTTNGYGVTVTTISSSGSVSTTSSVTVTTNSDLPKIGTAIIVVVVVVAAGLVAFVVYKYVYLRRRHHHYQSL